jgi:methylated-DNA-[protein]-cysteine S-methyltransferase
MKMESLIRSVAGDFADEAVEELLVRSRGKVDRALKRVRRPAAAVGVVKSKLGRLLVAMSARGLVLNHYLEDTSDAAVAVAKLRLEFDLVEDQRVVGEIGEEVDRYLIGETNVLRQNIDLTLAASAFQKKVLDRLQDVPRGAVISYQALGVAAGSARSARAVGNALHNNPVPIYVPCHRVVLSDGRIGGYGGGVPRKLQLLRSEGFAVHSHTATIADTAVWGHNGTKIYCRPSCRTSASVDRARILFFADPEPAQRAGMRPCKICLPG